MMADDEIYIVRGTCVIENFLESDGPKNVLMRRRSSRGVDHLVMFVIIKEENGERFVCPNVLCDNSKRLKLGIRYFLNPVNSRNSTEHLHKARGLYSERVFGLDGKGILYSDLVNPENGYLENGALTFEYGIHVDSIQDKDDIWNFNFEEYMHGVGTTIMIDDEEHDEYNLCHKQYLTFHSKFFAPYDSKLIPTNYKISIYHDDPDTKWTEFCMQIAHGVRLNLDATVLLPVSSKARVFQLPNVLRYCEDQLILKDTLNDLDWSLRCAYSHRLHRYMNDILWYVDSFEKIKWMFTDQYILNMSTNNMKLVVKRIFEGDLK